MSTPANTAPPAVAAPPPGLFARWMEARIGIVPVPVYLLLAAIITWYVLGEGRLPNEISMSIAVLVVFGFGCAEIGKRYPGLTGEGRLQPGGGAEMDAKDDHVSSHVDITHIAAAGITAVSLYLAGLLGHSLFHFPAPVTMLFLAVVLKLLHLVTPSIKEGAYVVYKFFSTGVTYPLLFAIGVAMTPWDQLVAAFTLPNLITIVATVVTLMGTGFLVGRRMGLYPIESAVINACHSGQGGTGDVAILTAANRMVLIPFAQIATRIGGAITVTLTLLVLSQMH